MIGNVVLNAGTSLFIGQPDVSLRLIEIRMWDDSENVLLRYEVLRHPGEQTDGPQRPIQVL
jgi:hypothetical protein